MVPYCDVVEVDAVEKAFVSFCSKFWKRFLAYVCQQLVQVHPSSTTSWDASFDSQRNYHR